MVKKVALLVIDMQQRCRQDTKLKDEFDAAASHIQYAVALFAAAELPIIVIQDCEDGGPGSAGFDCVAELQLPTSAISIHKTHSNAFWQTDLERVLHDLAVDGVVVCGYAAEYCVLATYNGAEERGFTPLVLQAAVAGVTRQGIAQMGKMYATVSLTALDYFLN